MKLPRVISLPLATLAILLASCAAQFPFIAPAALSETTDLKALCAQRKIAAAELAVADSLYALGAALVTKKKNEAAFALLDRAAVHYRIALTKASILDKEKEMSRQELALSKTREDVSAYKQVLRELSTMEPKP